MAANTRLFLQWNDRDLILELLQQARAYAFDLHNVVTRLKSLRTIGLSIVDDGLGAGGADLVEAAERCGSGGVGVDLLLDFRNQGLVDGHLGAQWAMVG